MPMLARQVANRERRLSAEGPSQPGEGKADLETSRIGLVSSQTELAKAAEAMLRRR